MYKLHTNCRACGYGPPESPDGIKAGDSADQLVSVLNLGVMPLPNAFVKRNEERPGHYPIELMVCPQCNLGQLSVVVDPSVIYRHYSYVTSPSETMKNHFRSLIEEVRLEGSIANVVEIGSNDGKLLEFFKSNGSERVFGIDPAENLVDISRSKGINTSCSLFDRSSAELAKSTLGTVDLVLARHVFCHINNWQEFINNLAVLSSRETLVCIEVPYAQDTIDNCEWDQVYAEHLSYLNIKAMQYLLNGSAFRLHNIVKFSVHGGAVAIFLKRTDSNVPTKSSVQTFLDNERCYIADWQAFAARARDQITNMKLLVDSIRKDGKRVVGYGASAKGTQWINACGFKRKDIEAVYDYTEQKLYTTVPGTNIPVVHEGAFYADGADYAVCLAWNFLPEIMKRQEKWIKGGGRFIVPVPEVRVL